MSYISGLIESNLKSLTEMLKSSLAKEAISLSDLRAALEAEAAPVPAGGDIYNVTGITTETKRIEVNTSNQEANEDNET